MSFLPRADLKKALSVFEAACLGTAGRFETDMVVDEALPNLRESRTFAFRPGWARDSDVAGRGVRARVARISVCIVPKKKGAVFCLWNEALCSASGMRAASGCAWKLTEEEKKRTIPKRIRRIKNFGQKQVPPH